MNKFVKTKKNKKEILFLIKIAVTILLCAIILWKVDWENIWNGLQQTNLFLLLVVFILALTCVAISTFKWQVLLLINGVHFNFNKLLRYYLTAMFLNNFLPSSIGGDGYRIYKTLDNLHSRSCAVIAVFMERFTGILALLSLGFIGGIISFLQKGDDLSRLAVIYGSIGASILIPLLYLTSRKRTITWLLKRKKLPQRIKNVIDHLGDYHHHPLKALQVILISFFFHMVTLFFIMLLIYAVGESCSIFNLALVVATSTVVAMLPISINGIGLMDGSFIYLIGKFGMGYESALMVILLIRALTIFISLFGGYLYLREGHPIWSKVQSLEK